MNSVKAFENNVNSQVGFLTKFKPQKQLSIQQQKRAVFCGAGDSLASAMLAESFSDFKTRAMDPLDLIKNKKLADSRSLYFVSISGRTVSNIKAAGLTKKTTAITKNTTSPLAKICRNIIPLQYQDSGVLTAGSIDFLESMLTCISLVSAVKIKKPQWLFLTAKRQANKITLKNKIYFLGNQHTYPLTMYAAAKVYEMLGFDAHYERIEQFLHMGLFSTKKGDTVIIFERPNKHNKQIASQLKKLGLTVYNPTIDSDKISEAVFYTFLSQLVVLYRAKKRRLSECYFFTEKKTQNASSAMIY
jgi:fructoselysine-6-P-deglycase FrlB-like protein